MATLSQIDHAAFWKDDKTLYQDQLARIFEPVFSQFDKLLRRHAIFHIFFFLLGFCELFLLTTFFTFFSQSMMLALVLAAIFFTFFTYFTLRLYLQAKKPEQIKDLKERFLSACKSLLSAHGDIPEQHLAIAAACCKLANRFHAREYSYYCPPKLFSFFASFLEKYSCWSHWQDVHLMKELLLQESVKEHIKLIKMQPVSLQAHASLANAYVMLSGLYIDPRKIGRYDDELWVPEEKYSKASEAKFRAIAERAIEEFKILNEYAPNDPWVHSQLAYSYHDLQMPMEEIKEYEILQKLVPEDRDNLFKLGILYFQQGLNAKGLKIYEELKRAQYASADTLINHYGSEFAIDFLTPDSPFSKI